MASSRRFQTWTVSIFVLLMTVNTCESVADIDYDELEPFREWLVAAGRMIPETSKLAPPDEDDGISVEESSLNIRDNNDYLPSSAEVDYSDLRGRDVLRRAWADWQKSRHDEEVIPVASKRSYSCMRRCLSQGDLHPAQCHSLC